MPWLPSSTRSKRRTFSASPMVLVRVVVWPTLGCQPPAGPRSRYCLLRLLSDGNVGQARNFLIPLANAQPRSSERKAISRNPASHLVSPLNAHSLFHGCSSSLSVTTSLIASSEYVSGK